MISLEDQGVLEAAVTFSFHSFLHPAVALVPSLFAARLFFSALTTIIFCLWGPEALSLLLSTLPRVTANPVSTIRHGTQSARPHRPVTVDLITENHGWETPSLEATVRQVQSWLDVLLN